MENFNEKDLLKLLWVFHRLCINEVYSDTHFSLLKYLNDYNLLNQENIKPIIGKINEKDLYIF